jgi:hypothetical protein
MLLAYILQLVHHVKILCETLSFTNLKEYKEKIKLKMIKVMKLCPKPNIAICFCWYSPFEYLTQQ